MPVSYFPIRIQLITAVLCALFLQPVSVFAAASDFIGNSDDMCELPAAQDSAATTPEAMLTQASAQSVAEATQLQRNTDPNGHLDQDWYWWLVGILAGGLLIVFIGRMRLSQSR